MTQQKTKTEIDKLKADWMSDPWWDLIDTEGFEDYRQELQEFQDKTEAQWEAARLAEISRRASELECSKALAEYIIGLEDHLRMVDARFYEVHP